MSHQHSIEEYALYCKQYESLRSLGKSEIESFNILQNHGYDLSLSTLHAHIKTMKETGSPLKIEKLTGAKSKLNQEQFDELEKWISDQNAKREEVTRADVQKYIFDTWDIETSVQTCGTYLQKMKFSLHEGDSVRAVPTKPNTELVDMAWKFISMLSLLYHIFALSGRKVRSIDVVYDRRPTGRRKTYSKVGKRVPKL